MAGFTKGYDCAWKNLPHGVLKAQTAATQLQNLALKNFGKSCVSIMGNNPNQINNVASEFVDLIQKEINSICPEESMSVLLEIGQIENCQLLNGNIVLTIKKFKDKSLYNLVLKPIEWSKVKPNAA